MIKRILSIAALATLTLPISASALPRTLPAFEIQMEICRDGLDMIIAGAGDEQERDARKALRQQS